MKVRSQFRCYPTDDQKQSLSQLFGCVRVVWNDAIALCKQLEKKLKSAELQKLIIARVKKTKERAYLSEVSAIPLQQSIADLEIAFKNFFESCSCKRKGRIVGNPKFNKRTRRNTTRIRITKLHNQIAGTRKDFLHKLSTKIVEENQVIIFVDLNVSGMVKNRKLAMAISQQGWYEFRVLCEAKADRFGREFRAIDRWEPSSQVCSELLGQ